MGLADRNFQTIHTNGVNLRCVVEGDGPLIILMHGWPQCWYLWRHQIDPLIEQGWKVCVPDQRGFGLTGGPEDPMQYNLGIFCDDLVGLMDAKGIEKAVFCGHDWGGAVVWAMPMLHPDRCLGVIGLNTAASRPSSLPPVETREPSLIVMSPRYYFATFQQPVLKSPLLV